MSRMLGTVSMGLRAPIIRSGDDLVEIVTASLAPNQCPVCDHERGYFIRLELAPFTRG